MAAENNDLLEYRAIRALSRQEGYEPRSQRGAPDEMEFPHVEHIGGT